MTKVCTGILMAAMLLSLNGCGKAKSNPDQAGGATEAAMIRLDGSSTVFPISEAVAEEYQKANPSHRVPVGATGTGGGFKKFAAGEIDIVDASRPIKPTEVEACQAAGVEFIELPIAYDGLAILVNPQNSWASDITVKELKTIWEPEAQGKVLRWNQVRPGWPDEELHLYGPGVDSGTYDYFTQAIVGKEHSSRGDFTSSEDDNVLVTGIAGDRLALGFFGLAYYEENNDKLKVVPLNDEDDANGASAIVPSAATVKDGTYQPLSRPLFIYVNKAALARPEIAAFVKFYLSNAAALAAEVGYIPLPDKAYTLAQERVDKGIVGSLFGGKGSQVGVRIEQLLEAEQKK